MSYTCTLYNCPIKSILWGENYVVKPIKHIYTHKSVHVGTLGTFYLATTLLHGPSGNMGTFYSHVEHFTWQLPYSYKIRVISMLPAKQVINM
jgi:phage-related protein